MLKKELKKIKGLFGKDSINYNLDHFDDGVLSGWGMSSKDANKHLDVKIFHDGVSVFTSKADLFREDLAQAGMGDGKHAFIIELNQVANLSPGDLIDVYIENIKMNNESVVVKFPEWDSQEKETLVQVQEEQLEVEQVNRLESYRIQIDVSKPGLLVGWVMDRERATHRAEVACYLDDVVLGSTIANGSRADLVASGVGDKTGTYAFEIEYNLDLLPDFDTSVLLKVDGQNVARNDVELMLSGDRIVESKIKQKLNIFNGLVRQEISVIGKQIKQTNIKEGLPADSVSGVVNTLIEKVSELSARCAVLEDALSQKNRNS